MDGVAVGVEDLVGVGEGFGAIGLAVFTTCQINFLPLLTHLNCLPTDFVREPTFEQAPPAFIAPVEDEKAMGVAMTAIAKTNAEIISGDFFMEVVMRKTLPLSEC